MAEKLISPELAAVLRATARGRTTPGAELAHATWFRVGGPAEWLFQPADVVDLATVLAALPVEIPVTILGVGSNVLIRDAGLPGLAVRLSARGFGALAIEPDHHIRAGAAALDKRVAAFARQQGIGGLAFLHGIPGAVGGAVRMNAGASGVEIKERLIEATAVDRGGRIRRFSNAELGFSYRTVAAASDLVFTEALFRGAAMSAAIIDEEMAKVQSHRERAQPVREKTGGSTFKNPDPPGTPNQRSAWELIEAAGCRGLTIGDAAVSTLHCNFLVNRGQARARDLEMLGETVRARVFAATGIELEWEIKRLGAFTPGDEVVPFLGQLPTAQGRTG